MCTCQRRWQRRFLHHWLCGSRQPGQLPAPLPPRTAQISQQLPKEHPGSDPGVPMYTVAPMRERERGSSHLWPSLTAQDWRGEVAQKAHRRKNKYIQRPLLTARPLPCQPHSQWSESQCAVSLSLRAQMRPSYDGHLHKSPRHPDKQLRLKLEIEFNIHSQQFPKCCLSDLQYAHTRWKWLSYKNILMSHVLSQRQTCGYGGLSASLPCLLRLLLNYHEATCALKRGKYLRKANITLQLLAKTPSIKSLPFLDFIDWLPLTGLVMF